MVTGWSYLVGSKGVPASCISCTRAFPLEVTRSETWMGLFMSISAIGGSSVTEPCQVAARVFSLSKDFWASDWAAGDWATTDSERAKVTNPRVSICLYFMVLRLLWMALGTFAREHH